MSQDRAGASGHTQNTLLYQKNKSQNRRDGAGGIVSKRGMKLANINLDTGSSVVG